MATKGFSALKQLRNVEASSQEEEKKETSNLEKQENSKRESLLTWESLGTEVQITTKRRLKAYAGQSGQKVKHLVDKAINEFLDRQSD
jgi:CRISPR/Cas system-associated protein Cas7 (RAMP superfamily)